MLINNLFNEFQYDEAVAITKVAKLNKDMLREKRIIIAGLESWTLTQQIVGSFLALNDRSQLHIEVIVLGDNARTVHESSPIFLREEVKCMGLDAVHCLNSADYLVYTGICNKKGSDAVINGQVEDIEKVMEIASRLQVKRAVLLSDYRAYQQVPRNVVVSEREYSEQKLERQTGVKRIEEAWREKADLSGVAWVILRAAIGLGGCSDFDSHPLHELFQKAGQGEEISFALNDNKYSFVAIHDIISATVFSLSECKAGECYNVVGEEATVNSFDIANALYQSVKDTAPLCYTKGESDKAESTALDASKLLLAGWSPKIPFADALMMHVKSWQMEEGAFLFNDTYNGKLEAIQQLMILVLLEIDRICKKHDIKYFLGGGTLLGAIRHKGFIPWDDDADLMMMREEYEKFVAVAPKELPDYLVLQTAKTDPNNHFFTKIRVKDTVCKTKFTKQFPELENGFFVDIFPHDYTANSKLGQKLHRQFTTLGRSLVFNKWGNSYVQGDGSHKVFRFLATCIKTVLPMSVLEWFQFYVIEFFAHKKNRHYLYDGMGQNLNKGAFPKEWLDEVIYTEFAGHDFPVPKEYDNYLTLLYGDYMQLIPVSERKNSHNIYQMDLGCYVLKNGDSKFISRSNENE